MDIRQVRIAVHLGKVVHLCKCQSCGDTHFTLISGGTLKGGWKHIARCVTCLRIKHATQGDPTITDDGVLIVKTCD